MLQRLERQHSGADVAGLAVPDEFDLALVLEQDEAIFLRQGLALLDEGDQVALFGVAQVVGFPCRGVPSSAPSWYSRKALASPANDDGLCCLETS